MWKSWHKVCAKRKILLKDKIKKTKKNLLQEKLLKYYT